MFDCLHGASKNPRTQYHNDSQLFHAPDGTDLSNPMERPLEEQRGVAFEILINAIHPHWVTHHLGVLHQPVNRYQTIWQLIVTTPMRTRLQTTTMCRTPPSLCRTSAIAAVKFTRNGRRLARRMMIPTRDASVYYYFTMLHGETTHHFSTTSGTFSVSGTVVPEFVTVPLP